MILDEIVVRKRVRLAEQKGRVSDEEMRCLAAGCNRVGIGFCEAVRKEGLSVIGEFKNASPSHGIMANGLSLVDRMGQYGRSVDAVSCLTEEDFFQGSVECFREIRGMCHLPMLRKDFIVDVYQIFEAKVIGADCILLIVAILQDRELKLFYDLAVSLGLDVLVEVHDEEELKRAVRLDAVMVGVNNRNLKDFSVDLKVTRRLAGMVPEGMLLVSESGIGGVEDVAALKGCGVSGVLAGTALMESACPADVAAAWKRVFLE